MHSSHESFRSIRTQQCANYKMNIRYNKFILSNRPRKSNFILYKWNHRRNTSQFFYRARKRTKLANMYSDRIKLRNRNKASIYHIPIRYSGSDVCVVSAFRLRIQNTCRASSRITGTTLDSARYWPSMTVDRLLNRPGRIIPLCSSLFV